jgi:hypothetical protein
VKLDQVEHRRVVDEPLPVAAREPRVMVVADPGPVSIDEMLRAVVEERHQAKALAVLTVERDTIDVGEVTPSNRSISVIPGETSDRVPHSPSAMESRSSTTSPCRAVAGFARYSAGD